MLSEHTDSIHHRHLQALPALIHAVLQGLPQVFFIKNIEIEKKITAIQYISQALSFFAKVSNHFEYLIFLRLKVWKKFHHIQRNQFLEKL